MTLALRAKNKIGFVDGTLPKPPDNHQTHALWSCRGLQVLYLMISDQKEYNVSQDCSSNVVKAQNRNDNFRVYQIMVQLRDLKQHGSMDINDYFTRFITLWNELKYYEAPVVCHCECTCGAKEALEKYEERECLMQFLIGVNQSHRHTIDMILTEKPLTEKPLPGF